MSRPGAHVKAKAARRAATFATIGPVLLLLLSGHAVASEADAAVTKLHGPRTQLPSGVTLLPDVMLGPGSDEVTVSADLYCSSSAPPPSNCTGESEEAPAGKPLIFVLPGGFGLKGNYSEFSAALADSGYVVAVLEQLRTIPGAVEDPTNIIGPLALSSAMPWMEANKEALAEALPGCGAVDLESVMLAGHGHGAFTALEILAGNATTGFLASGAIEQYPQVLGAFLYGYAAYNAFNEEWQPIEQSSAQKLFIANGDKDPVADDSPGTDRVLTHDAHMIVSDADHYSMADDVFFARPGDEYSSRTREVQNAVVSDAAVAAFRAMQLGRPCDDLVSAGQGDVDGVASQLFGDAFLQDWKSWLQVLGQPSYAKGTVPSEEAGSETAQCPSNEQ